MSEMVTEEVVATIEMPVEAEKEKEIKQEVSSVELTAKEMAISSDADYERAAEFGKSIKKQAKVVTDFFKPMKDSAYKAHKEICDREKTMLKPLQEAEKNLKRGMKNYYQEKERKRLELEAKLRREAEEERERKLNEAAELETAGEKEAAEAALLDAQVTEEIAVNTSVIAEPVRTKGVTNTKDWEIQSIDKEKVPVVFAGMEIRPVDEKAITRLIRASKGTIQIPGVTYKETIKISIRG